MRISMFLGLVSIFLFVEKIIDDSESKGMKKGSFLAPFCVCLYVNNLNGTIVSILETSDLLCHHTISLTHIIINSILVIIDTFIRIAFR